MAEVKINRELLSDLRDDLLTRHLLDKTECSCVTRESACPTAQRLERVSGLLERSP
jgi:hypothetical protein